MLAFLGKRNEQQFGFLAFYDNPHPAMMVFCFVGDGAGQNISKTTGTIMKRKCLCSSSPESVEKEVSGKENLVLQVTLAYVLLENI